MLAFLIENIFNWENFQYLIIFIGFEAILFYFYENFLTPLQIYKNYFQELLNPNSKLPFSIKYGKWAVITGATDGIGKEYAKELARKGLNIVLISRCKEKLIETAQEIENSFHVKTEWIVADFSKKKIYDNIENRLQGLDIGILVNNVGQMYEYCEEFANICPTKLWDMMIVNVGACTMMTRLVVNQMKDNKRGAIINISSMLSVCFAPYSTTYAATKVYMKHFSKGLEWELEPYNITVQLVTPGIVATNLIKRYPNVYNHSVLTVTASKLVKSAIFTLGKTNETTGYWGHAIQLASMNLLPIEVNSWLIVKLFKHLYNRKHQI